MGDKGRVLVVDGNADFADNVVEVLAEFGYSAERARSASDAIERAAGFDCVVSEHAMPRVDGVGLIDELRRRGTPVPVVVLSAHSDEELSRRALSAGALMVLSKDDFERWACALLHTLEKLRHPASDVVMKRAEPRPTRAAKADLLRSAS